MKKHIPNILTLLNALSGFVGIVAAFYGEWRLTFYTLFIATFFDLLDGMVARLLKVSSEIGKQLDSMSDLISFGVLPGVIMYKLLKDSHNIPHIEIDNLYFHIPTLLPLLAGIIPMFSALRLAKFNIDTRQTSSFIGLPTPANALFIGSYSMIINSYCDCDPSIQLMSSWPVLLCITILTSVLLVAEIPLFSFKLKNLRPTDNPLQFTYLGIMLVVLILVFVLEGGSKWFLVINYGILIYLVLSLLWKYVLRKDV